MKLIVEMEMPCNIQYLAGLHGTPTCPIKKRMCKDANNPPKWCPIKGELVLCGKCYYKDEKRIMDEDALWCRKHHMYVTADWFCADGDRKEGRCGNGGK